MESARAHVYISGQVQGVMFRESTRRQAYQRKVRGWVRNLSDGRVEAVFEGSKGDVQALVQWCHHGPSRARVDSVLVDWEAFRGDLEGFEVVEGWTW